MTPIESEALPAEVIKQVKAPLLAIPENIPFHRLSQMLLHANTLLTVIIVDGSFCQQ